MLGLIDKTRKSGDDTAGSGGAAENVTVVLPADADAVTVDAADDTSLGRSRLMTLRVRHLNGEGNRVAAVKGEPGKVPMEEHASPGRGG